VNKSPLAATKALLLSVAEGSPSVPAKGCLGVQSISDFGTEDPEIVAYFGHAVALSTADNLEYQGLGWMNPESNDAYAKARISTDQHPLCTVCEMDVDPATAPKSTYRRRTYYFCMDAHKWLFDADPDRFVVG
jgi:YHS domain-containing protein